MSYKHLTGRLIETQRSMLGASAIDIARSIDGLSVTDDGNVTEIDGDGRDIVEELARRYTDVLGAPAERRLVTAAREFEDELLMPPALGGPDDAELGPETVTEGAQGPSTESPARHGPAAAGSTTGAVSDGGTVALHSPTPTDTVEAGETSEASPETVERADSTGEESTDASDGPSRSEPHIVRYAVASDIAATDPAEADLGAVYLLPSGERGWQVPVSVADAVADAVSEATDVDDSVVRALVDSLDADRLLATLAGDNGETVSFHERGVTVTVHQSGSLAVH